MNSGQTVFSQLMDLLPLHELRKCVRAHLDPGKIRTFSCLDQYLAMAFAQLSGRESLRDIEACLRAQRSKLYHMGMRSLPARSTLADANESRPWQIWMALSHALIAQARPLYGDHPLGIDLDRTLYALDTTTVDLCLSLFPWARFRRAKGGVRIHTLMDLRGSVPTFAVITDAKTHEVNTLDLIEWEAGAIYVMDRGFLDFARLFAAHQSGSFFVIRAKANLDFRRIYSRTGERGESIQCDQSIRLQGPLSSRLYPEQLRRVRCLDPRSSQRLVLLSNNFSLAASTISAIYRLRWQIELFFKWIKQHLRIKSFLGTSENAVKSQIWIAISVYVLVAIARKRWSLERLSLYTILQILSVTLFEKMPVLQAFSQDDYKTGEEPPFEQLELFEL